MEGDESFLQIPLRLQQYCRAYMWAVRLHTRRQHSKIHRVIPNFCRIVVHWKTFLLHIGVYLCALLFVWTVTQSPLFLVRKVYRQRWKDILCWWPNPIELCVNNKCMFSYQTRKCSLYLTLISSSWLTPSKLAHLFQHTVTINQKEKLYLHNFHYTNPSLLLSIMKRILYFCRKCKCDNEQN